ncbi:MAG TPA: ROK family protein [Bryobacteraceae bacterium]|nr:ROK family protein [Bryobacteraceae bacterium]
MDSVIAIDLGGTKLTAAVVDENGTISSQRKVAAVRGDVRASAAQIAELISGLQARAAGLIIPGISSERTGTAWAPNLWGHDHVPLRDELERVLPLPVIIDSDRAGYVMGEAWLGAARGLSDVVFLAVGTGIGAGIISGGRLLRGAGDIAGAVGWFALDPAWRDDYAQTGCWEAESGGPALARGAGMKNAEEVVAAARAGDPRACDAVDRAVTFMAMGIANLISVLNPQMIVLGGGLMQASGLFLERIRQRTARWAQPVAATQVRIEVSQLGENAGLLGAAKLALDGIYVRS